MSPQAGPPVQRIKRSDALEGSGTRKTKCYTPQLRREIVSRLYHRAKAEGVPMTRLANKLMEAALDSRDANLDLGGVQ